MTGDRASVYFPKDAVTGYLVGYVMGGGIGSAFICKTTDGGTSWIGQSSPQDCYNLDCVQFPVDVLTGWAVGYYDILKTTDGGGSWIEEKTAMHNSQGHLNPTIFRGPLVLPKGKTCRVFDITGRVVEPARMAPGVYFVEIDGKIAQKFVKVK